MTKNTFTVALTFSLGMMFNNLLGQNCSDIKLKTGAVLTYNTEAYSYPIQTKDAAYFKLSEKKRAEADNEFMLANPDSLVKPRFGKFTTKLVSVEDLDGGIKRFTYHKDVWGTIEPSKILCNGNMIAIEPKKLIDSVAWINGYKKTFYGYNKIPLSLNLGDTLPDYENVSLSALPNYQFPFERKYLDYHEFQSTGTIWQITEKSIVDMGGTEMTIESFTNRQVVEVRDMLIDGVTYKAYVILKEGRLKPSSQIKSSSAFHTYIARTQRRKVEKKVNKILGGNENGVKAYVQYDWFIPQLGVIAKTEVYSSEGRLLALNYLSHIEHP